jgi:Ca-activated chloride channel family protein
MSTAASPAVLRTVDGVPVPLQGVAVKGRLSDLLAEVEVTQTYRNGETVPIEAVYAFPLPIDAVLLEVEAVLGDRHLAGRVTARSAAERDYEEAIVAGDAALMIERPEPGLHIMNVGNLLPGAEARITFRYATVLRCHRGRYRFLHPTTIAPRYGRWALEPHQVPETSLVIDHTCTLELEIAGVLAGAQFDSPSHEVDVERRDDRATIRLRHGHMLMDRDFVLDLRVERKGHAAVLIGADLEGGHACLAVLHADPSSGAEAAPRDLKIVVDCSGSMQGDSIAQARVAVQRILEALRPQDRFTVVLFGSTQRVLFPAMMPGDETKIAGALRAVDEAMAESMGGTEMGAALAAAYRIPVRPEATPTLMLVTDGEITDVQGVTGAARASRHRFFTVGVGSAVAERLLRDLAAATGGACELVTPREDMAERIVRHFRRVDSGGARLTIGWPAPARDVVGEDEPVFGGDTAVVFARFEGAVDGTVRFNLALPDGRRVEKTVAMPTVDSIGEVGTIARLAAARRLLTLGAAIDAAAEEQRERLEADAASLAERYQLLSPWTNWVLVVAQAKEQAGDLPVLRKVSQMLAAGWGGVGTVACAKPLLRQRVLFAAAPSTDAPVPACSPDGIDARLTHVLGSFESFSERFPADGFAEPRDLVQLLATKHRDSRPSIDDLDRIESIPADAIAALRRLVASGIDEAYVVVAFLVLLAEGALGHTFDRATRRRILRLCRDFRPSAALAQELRQALGLIAGADSSSQSEVSQ